MMKIRAMGSQPLTPTLMAPIVDGFPLAGLTLLRHHFDHWAAPECFLRDQATTVAGVDT